MSNQDPYQQYPAGGWQPTRTTLRPSGPGPVRGSPRTASPPYGQPATMASPLRSSPRYAPARATVSPSPPTAPPAIGAAPGVRCGPCLRRSARRRTDLRRTPPSDTPATSSASAFTYAPWIQRVGAYFLDSLASLPYLVGLTLRWRPRRCRASTGSGNPTDQPTTRAALAFGVGASGVPRPVGLEPLGPWRADGQSWGKKVRRSDAAARRDGGADRRLDGVLARPRALRRRGPVYLGYLLAAVGRQASDVLGQAHQVGRRPVTSVRSASA